ncbi:hypothetical protein TNCV_839961 [Trichonephila clavipes]|nr:hypothetical protein TNCV_839961 [Trichonephila clavipes]
MTRIPYHMNQLNQFAHRQQYGGWNWRNDQSQHPDTITNTRYKVYSPQFPSPYHHPSFSLQRPTLYPRNQRFPQRPTLLRPNVLQLSTPVKEHKTIIRYSNLIKQENL